MRIIRSIAASGVVLGGAGYLLFRFAPAPAELVRRLSAPRDWIGQVGTDAAVATVAATLLWLCALWVAIGFAAAWLGQLPGLAGRFGRTVTRCAVPVAIQRLVAASAGFSLLLGGASASAIGQLSGGPASPTGTISAPGWPLNPSPDSAGPTISAAPAGPTTADNQPASRPPPTVTVRPGDSLWTIAGAELGPTATDRQIAVAWPYWYRANRPLIGRDPNLLRPGSRLSRPGAVPAGERPDGGSGRPRQPIQEGLRP